MEEHTGRTQDRETASRGLQGVREAAQRDPGLRFTTLLHHVNEKLLRDSFYLYLLKKQAAPGVDRVTWGEYEEGVEDRIKDLHGRIHRGAYRAQPSRRVYIPKPDGRPRPLGIAALEDKLVQQAVVEVLNQIYERDFAGFSYGFRPGRSARDALDSLSAGIMTKKVNWILDADIRGFFDHISHAKLMELMELRIADPRMPRLIGKWLTAGVSEDGQWSETKVGTPQGAVISPLLANIHLHYVLDRWVMEWRREFGRFAEGNRKRGGEGKPETFNFLGFTHIRGTIWASGKFTVKRKTVGRRMTAKLKNIAAELDQRLHDPIQQTGAITRYLATCGGSRRSGGQQRGSGCLG